MDSLIEVFRAELGAVITHEKPPKPPKILAITPDGGGKATKGKDGGGKGQDGGKGKDGGKGQKGKNAGGAGSRINGPCQFYLSPNGCRHGAQCYNFHDTKRFDPNR